MNIQYSSLCLKLQLKSYSVATTLLATRTYSIQHDRRDTAYNIQHTHDRKDTAYMIQTVGKVIFNPVLVSHLQLYFIQQHMLHVSG